MSQDTQVEVSTPDNEKTLHRDDTKKGNVPLKCVEATEESAKEPEHCHDNCIVLCTTCEATYHIYCISPTLEHIPGGDWHCAACVGLEKGNESVPKYNGIEGHHCIVCE